MSKKQRSQSQLQQTQIGLERSRYPIPSVLNIVDINLKFIKHIYYKLMRKKTIFTLVPQQNQLSPITSSDFNWHSTSNDPYFYLTPRNNKSYPQGWSIVYADLEAKDNNILKPLLYIDTGLGYQKHLYISLPCSQQGKIFSIVCLPNKVQGLRFHPSEQSCHFKIGEVAIQEITTIEAKARYLYIFATLLLQKPTHIIDKARRVYMLWQQDGIEVLKDIVIQKLKKSQSIQIVQDPNQWYNQRYRPDDKLLSKFRAYQPSENSPTFSLLMPVYNTPEDWLRQAVMSIVSQTYTNWELLCINDGSTLSHVQPLLDKLATLDKRIRVIHLENHSGVSTASNIGLKSVQGDYVCFLDHDDYLEPQALHRFAETVLTAYPDLIYSDEIITTSDIDTVINVAVRPEFSYDYYISHPYFVHFVGVRTGLLREIGGFDETMRVSQNYDLILRVLEKAKTVSHIPDILYRWRSHDQILDCNEKEVIDSSIGALSRHMMRLGCKSQVQPGASFNFYNVNFQFTTPAKIAVLIPTKNRKDLLEKCIDSLEKTVLSETADIYIIDHESDDFVTQLYLTQVATRHHVIPYKGSFNFSAMMNFGVEMVSRQYSHYLFLNNDIEAIENGWLEHLLSLARRREVGIVGAMLLYPDQTIQHAGVILGLHGVAEHAHKFAPFYCQNGERNSGFNGTLLSNRDFSAVTAACLLMRADVFNQLNGFDEKLAVGFGDVDLCLRTRKAGYKVLMDAHAVLIHHESASRGNTPHKEDSQLFVTRYRHIIANGDPCFSPLLSRQSSQFELNLFTKSPQKMKPRTVGVILPQPDD